MEDVKNLKELLGEDLGMLEESLQKILSMKEPGEMQKSEEVKSALRRLSIYLENNRRMEGVFSVNCSKPVEGRKLHLFTYEKDGLVGVKEEHYVYP